MYKSVLQKVLLGLTVLAFISCDKDFNEIGSEIVGDDHFGFLSEFDVTVEANTVATGPVESRNLPVNPLGVFTNSTFGTTVASFVTQVEVGTLNPNFDASLNPQVTNVELVVPYFSRRVGTGEEGNRLYELDSVFGNGTFDLKVYRSGYYLRDINYDGETQEAQLFYTDEGPTINSFKIGAPLNNLADVPAQNTAFFFDENGYDVIDVDADGDETTTEFPPSMRLFLDNDVFQQAIVEAPAGVLTSNNVFKNYFRGLYFQVSQNGSNPGELAMLNFKGGKVNITYEQDQQKCVMVNGEEVCSTIRAKKTFVLNLTGNTASLQEHVNHQDYTNGLAQIPGNNSRLWLKGGEGSIATIDLFGDEDLDNNEVPDELDRIRAEDWLINEASLTFYVDQDEMSDAPEPPRIYLYDLTNRRPIIDYGSDGTTDSNPKFKKKIYGGIIEKQNVDNGRGIRYKVRLTNYMNELIKNGDSTNVRLGLSITEDINVFSMVKLRNANPALKNVIPTASVMSPLGTVLYGSVPGATVPEDKRLKLQIYYTKPE
ncbi:MAG TPA: DUF4270 domain-containing protein [Flavobacterium sp.]|jgi:hypothetical protein